MTIHTLWDLAHMIEETGQSLRHDLEGDVSNNAMIQLRPGSAEVVTADQCPEIELFVAPSSDQLLRRGQAEIAVDNQSPYTGLEVDDADAPSIDEEEICAEVSIRDRLIEWLVSFLPGESGGNNGAS